MRLIRSTISYTPSHSQVNNFNCFVNYKTHHFLWLSHLATDASSQIFHKIRSNAQILHKNNLLAAEPNVRVTTFELASSHQHLQLPTTSRAVEERNGKWLRRWRILQKKSPVGKGLQGSGMYEQQLCKISSVKELVKR